MRRIGMAIAAGALGLAMPAAAEEVIRAADPGGVATVLRRAGYPAELTTDPYGDPLIKTSFGDYSSSVFFYGCDAAAHDKCDSIQFRVGLDRKTPMALDQLNAILKKYRFAAMWIDEEGDPWVNFDLYTGSGIPDTVFLGALNAFRGNLGSVADEVFAEERSEDR